MEPTQQQLRNRELAASGVDLNTINSQAISATPTMRLGDTPTPIDFSGAITGNLDAFNQYIQSFNQPTQASQQQSTIQDELLRTIQTLGGEVSRTRELEQQAGLPQQQEELQKVINQLQGLSKEAAAIPLQLQQESFARGRTKEGGTVPIQTARLRENAIKALGLSAIGATLQGNIALAQQNIERAIEAEFEPQRTRLQLLQQAYLFNRDILEREDKKAAQRLEISLGERERLLKQQEGDKTKVWGFITEAVQNSVKNGFKVPDELIQRAQTLSPMEALQSLAPYLEDVAGKESAELDRKVKEAQIAQIYENMKKTEAERKKIEAEATGNIMIDPQTGKPTSELKVNAKNSARNLLEMVKAGKGLSAVGASRLFGFQFIPGTPQADLKVQFDNMKSLLSLDNIKLLKGQGQVSDAERRLLADASARISLTQSENTFKDSLQEIVIGLGQPLTVTLVDPNTQDRQRVLIDAEGLQAAKDDGLLIIFED